MRPTKHLNHPMSQASLMQSDAFLCSKQGAESSVQCKPAAKQLQRIYPTHFVVGSSEAGPSKSAVSNTVSCRHQLTAVWSQICPFDRCYTLTATAKGAGNSSLKPGLGSLPPGKYNAKTANVASVSNGEHYRKCQGTERPLSLPPCHTLATVRLFGWAREAVQVICTCVPAAGGSCSLLVRWRSRRPHRLRFRLLSHR